ncbi:hypothetical protein ACFRMQ_02955 [Kitasatospora sp. NPDC056783]|uniref:hypothetical protein n=1 Tax=Kitasatospora sp. NPDC056783 TaxID=3345943 RepID=UPI0036C855EC
MTSPKKPQRNYGSGSGTVAGLLTLARGRCYWPACKEPTVRMIEGDPVQNLQIAHVRALEDNGPRRAHLVGSRAQPLLRPAPALPPPPQGGGRPRPWADRGPGP